MQDGGIKRSASLLQVIAYDIRPNRENAREACRRNPRAARAAARLDNLWSGAHNHVARAMSKSLTAGK
jgi:hypothetical protein